MYFKGSKNYQIKIKKRRAIGQSCLGNQKKKEKKKVRGNIQTRRRKIRKKKKKKRKKARGSVQTRPNQNKKIEQWIGQAHVQVHMGISFIYLSNSIYSFFSQFWRENILLDPGRTHLDSTNFFPSPPPNQTPTKNVFLPFSF